MQFGALPGSAAGDSWSTYGVDGNGDGVADVYDPADAIPAAANYLCAHGAGAGTLEAIRDALYAYNHAWWYVDDVLSWARRYAQSSTSAPAQAAIAWAKQHLGVSPTHVGMDRVRGVPALVRASEPHARGDGPMSGDLEPVRPV